MPQAIHKNAYISFTDISIPVLIFLHDLGIFFLLTFVFFPFEVLICIYIMRYLTFSFALRHFFIVFHLLTIAFENSTCTVYCFQNKLSSVTAESIQTFTDMTHKIHHKPIFNFYYFRSSSFRGLNMKSLACAPPQMGCTQLLVMRMDLSESSVS